MIHPRSQASGWQNMVVLPAEFPFPLYLTDLLSPTFPSTPRVTYKFQFYLCFLEHITVACRQEPRMTRGAPHHARRSAQSISCCAAFNCPHKYKNICKLKIAHKMLSAPILEVWKD